MNTTSRGLAGFASALVAGFAWVAIALPVAGAAVAAETRIALPTGYELTSTDAVAMTDGRQAFAIARRGSKLGSRVMQIAASETLFTDLEGLADQVEYSADRTHLLVRQTLPESDQRRGTRVYSLIDNAGQVVWSAESTAPYRFTAGGNQLYVAQYPGDVPHIRVFDLRGNLLRAVELRRPYLDAVVLDGGNEAVVLFSTRPSRSTDTDMGREVSVQRIHLDEQQTVAWSIPLNQDALKYPELIPLDRDWVLITTEQGFVAVRRDGDSTRYGAEVFSTAVAGGVNPSSMRLAAGVGDDSLILYDPDRTLVLNLASGDLADIQTATTDSRFEDVGIRDRHVVRVLPGEVILKPLEGFSGPAARTVRAVGTKRKGGRTRER